MNSPHTAISFKVAVIQQPPVFLNIEESVEKACGLIEQANVVFFQEGAHILHVWYGFCTWRPRE